MAGCGLMNQAHAATATANFDVTLTIQADCSIAANPLNFGAKGVLSANVDAQTTVSVTCSNTTPYQVGLNAGLGAGATVANRLMTGGKTSATVAYQLYQDTARSTVWGNTQATDTVGGAGNGTAQALTVYGRIKPQATPAPDTYKDTVTATVYF
ncbi:spore coat U domain-containing protein [uncultured Castellaniella sp.]|uniref:Csu type fimbrial protein n=1 Tax=uncultured Castellaniella sp. TaxID=647907 RepID=UPI0026186FAF|nr:spore coat U domain-containing protein [uncultured Castellaniella sp.]